MKCRKFGSRFLDPEKRAANCCALEDWNTNDWTAEEVEHVHMGAPPDYEAEAVDSNWRYPPEPIEDEGCAGSWYRCEFVMSLLRYHRAPDAQGGRVDHHAYAACEDPFVWDCLRFLEAEEMAADSHRLKIING